MPARTGNLLRDYLENIGSWVEKQITILFVASWNPNGVHLVQTNNFRRNKTLKFTVRVLLIGSFPIGNPCKNLEDFLGWDIEGVSSHPPNSLPCVKEMWQEETASKRIRHVEKEQLSTDIASIRISPETILHSAMIRCCMIMRNSQTNNVSWIED